MVDDHFGGIERVNAVRVSTEGGHGLTHGCQIDDAGNSGEVLHNDTGGSELNLLIGFRGGLPRGECFNLRGGDVSAIFGAQQVLGQYLQRVR